MYGAQPAELYPLRETTAPRPRNPYAASKVAAEALALAYAASYGVDAVVTRAFNHIGPGQDERFAVAAFAAQIARAAAGGERRVSVGNLDASRDVLDVRDVCAAYVALLEGGGTAGEIYNVCSGTATTMRELLRRLIEIARVPVEVREDPARMRPADVPVSVGSADKLRSATGWAPHVSTWRRRCAPSTTTRVRNWCSREPFDKPSSSRTAARCSRCRPSRLQCWESRAHSRSRPACRSPLPARWCACGRSATAGRRLAATP